MTRLLGSIHEIADQFDAIVLDQWGVLHDGSAPYPSALTAINGLAARTLAVLSNSGKRAAPNAARIAAMGFDAACFDVVMTSGEALWQQFASGAGPATIYPIEGRSGDAADWAQGLPVEVVADIARAEAIVLMGLPDGCAPDSYDTALQAGLDRDVPLYCSNPDLTSPRGHGAYVMSPGVLAQRYASRGGTTHLFGKPHLPIFTAIQDALGCAPEKVLMVGDSLHHDIAGAQTAGWASLLIRGGIHAPDIAQDTLAADIARLSATAQIAPPTFSLPDLR